MKIIILIDCDNGLKKGEIKTINKRFADELIKRGIAKEYKPRKPRNKK